ncbi:MAG: OB-fold nucleic acid binding domain-containing protein, partial [Polaromonas sp.]
SVQGKVVKVNEGIMKRNFLHLQDGTGDANTNDLIVTSQQSAKVGDQVLITGKVALDKDFGSGYNYPLLLEATSVTVKK